LFWSLIKTTSSNSPNQKKAKKIGFFFGTGIFHRSRAFLIKILLFPSGGIPEGFLKGIPPGGLKIK
jgi:hypothetical protein